MLPSDKTMLSYRSIRAIISSFVAGVVAERSGYAQRWFGLAGIGRRTVEVPLKLQLAIPSRGSAVACFASFSCFGLEQESSIR